MSNRQKFSITMNANKVFSGKQFEGITPNNETVFFSFYYSKIVRRERASISEGKNDYSFLFWLFAFKWMMEHIAKEIKEETNFARERRDEEVG